MSSIDDYTKMEFEILKHLTTLSSAAIVIVAAFMKQLIGEPVPDVAGWLTGSLVGFVVCIVSSVFAMSVVLMEEKHILRLGLKVRDTSEPEGVPDLEALRLRVRDVWRKDIKATVLYVLHRMAIRVSAVSFVCGMIALVVFVNGNL